MANFMGIVIGKTRNAIHRLGHSQIETQANGWNKGIKVIGNRNQELNQNIFHIYTTGGSNGRAFDQLILEVLEDGEIRLSSYQCVECENVFKIKDLTPTMEWFSGHATIPELICHDCIDRKNGKI